MRFLVILLAIVFVSVGLSGSSYASSCPPEIDLSNKTLNADTEAGLSLVSKVLSEIGLGVSYSQERNSILIQVPNADQLILVHWFYKGVCELIMNSDWTTEKKLAELQKAQDEIFRRVYFRELVASTKEEQSRVPVHGTRVMFANHYTERKRHVWPPVWNAGIPNISFSNYYLVANDRPEFLREPPFVVTKANKYFVIVASAPSRDTAIKEMYRLKRKAPQYDFVVYGPYRGNPNYGIMMATWVSHDVAKKALELAKRDVRSDSFIWACRQEGDAC